MLENSSASDVTVEVDIAFVGAGPVGLYGAYCAGFRGLSTALIDALPAVGGQVAAMYPEKQIYDVAGFEAIRGRELVDGLSAQAARYSPHVVLGQSATELTQLSDSRLLLSCDGGASITARAVVITGGIGSFTPRVLPAAAGWEERGLVYFVPNLAACADRDVVIVGGGDSAFDWAQALESLARSITIVHRRERFRAHEGTVRAVRSSDTKILVNSSVSQVHGDSSISGVVVEDSSGFQEALPCQVLIAALGFQAQLGHLESWGLDIQDRHIVVDSTMNTGRSMLFAAGDITHYPGKVRLMSVGFGEVATAVNNAAVLIDSSADIFPGHSTDRGED